MKKLAHVSIRVKDIEASKKFYKDILEFKHIRDVENERLKFAFFDMGGAQLEVLQSKVAEEERMTGKIDHIALLVDNLNVEIEKLRKKGVTFTMEKPKEVLEYNIIFIEGPDKERIEMMEYK